MQKFPMHAFFPMHPFSTVRFSGVFKGLQKGGIENEWVNETIKKFIMNLYYEKIFL